MLNTLKIKQTWHHILDACNCHEHDSEPCSDPKHEPAKRLKCFTKNVSTHPPTPVVLSLEYGALFGSIAVTSFFHGSFYYSPDEADEVFPFQVFLEGRARSGRTRKQQSHNLTGSENAPLCHRLVPEDDTACVKRDAPSCSTCALLMFSPSSFCTLCEVQWT